MARTPRNSRQNIATVFLATIAAFCIFYLTVVYRWDQKYDCIDVHTCQRVQESAAWLLTKADMNTTTTYSSSIPRILHYVFKDEMPFDSYKPMIRSCLKLNPDWSVFLWRDSDSMRLIREHYKYFENKYVGYKDRLEKSDSVRYMILHRFGGIYLDMDVECLKPFDQLLQMRTAGSSAADGISAFLGEERREQTRILYGYSYCAMNSLMGSTPGHPFFQFVINRMLSVPDLNHARLSTGPDFLTRVYLSWVNCSECKQTRPHVEIFPARLVSPLMDTSLVNWETKCEQFLSMNPKPRQKSEDETRFNKEQDSWRRLGCAELVAKGWRCDDTESGTVAVHRFTHQGYGEERESRKTFHLLKTFPRIKTYYTDNSITP